MVLCWTFTPTAIGTTLQMQQEIFYAEWSWHYFGAQAGWPRFIGALELVLATIDEGKL